MLAICSYSIAEMDPVRCLLTDLLEQLNAVFLLFIYEVGLWYVDTPVIMETK